MLLQGPCAQGQEASTTVAALQGVAVQEGAGLRTWCRGDAPYFQNHIYAHMFLSCVYVHVILLLLVICVQYPSNNKLLA